MISDRVANHWRFAFGANGDEVVEDGRRRLGDVVRRWGLSDLLPLGRAYWGAAFVAREPGGLPVVLKVNPRTPMEGGWASEHAPEPQALRAWARAGAAVDVHRTAYDGSAYLMELGGASMRWGRLSSLEAVAALGELASRLHAAGGVEAAPHVGCSWEAARWREALAGTREGSQLEGLLVASSDDALVHLDLHVDNALRVDGGWKAIDPIAVVGDRHADVYALIFHPEFVLGVPSGRMRARRYVGTHLAAYCRAAQLERERAAAWLRCRLAYRIWRSEREQDAGDLWWTKGLPRVLECLPDA